MNLTLYRKFARQYLRSLRWLAAVLLAVLTTIIPVGFLPIFAGALNVITHLMPFFMA